MISRLGKRIADWWTRDWSVYGSLNAIMLIVAASGFVGATGMLFIGNHVAFAFGFLGLIFVSAIGGIVWAERIEKRRVQRLMAGRDLLSDEEFGECFFSPSQAHIAARTREILARHIDVDLSQLHPSDRPVEDLRMVALDSLSDVEFICDIEEEFDIKLEEQEGDQLRTVEDIVRYVSEKLAEKRSRTCDT